LTDDYFAEALFLTCSISTFFIIPRLTVIGIVASHYIHPFLPLPRYPFEGKRVVTVLNAVLSFVGTSASLLYCFRPSYSLLATSLIGPAVIENTARRLWDWFWKVQ
jgi:hypothetical protein